MAKKQSNKKKATSQGSSVPPKKTLRSQPPDVIVAVGQGDDQVEFECYKYALCYNCEYFDTMFSLPLRENETSRIHLPDKDPEEWKVFYEFIDPATSTLAEVTDKNAILLVPWFHEYRMDMLLAKCDDMIHHNMIHDDNDATVVSLMMLLDKFEFCERYSLERSLKKVVIVLSLLVMSDHALLKDNLNLFKRVHNVYKGQKDNMNELLCLQIQKLFTEIEVEENESDGEDIWKNKYFQRLIETKLEVVMLKQKYEYLESNYRDIKGSVVVRGAGLDVVNGIYIRHSEKWDSVDQFIKRGLFKDASCEFTLFRCFLSDNTRRWYISIVPENSHPGTNADVDFYSCTASGAVNERPCIDYNWVIETGNGIHPPPIVEYISQP